MSQSEELAAMVAEKVTASILAGTPKPGTDPGLLAEIDAKVSAEIKSATDGVLAQIEDRLTDQAAQITELRSLNDALSASLQAPPEPEPKAGTSLLDSIDGSAYNPHAAGAALDGKHDSWGDFVASVSRMRSGKIDPRMTIVPEAAEINAALTGEEIADGGALVPEEFRAQLLRVAMDENSIRRRAMVLPMSSSTLTIPRIDDLDHTDGNLFGGVQTYWLEAGDDVPESQPKFGQVQLTAHALAALTEVQNTTIADSAISVAGLIPMLFADAMRWREEASFLRGSGAGQPLGMFDSGAVIDVARAGGSANVVAADIHAMEGRLLPRSDMRAVWMVHPGLRTDLGALNLGGVQYLQEDLSRARPRSLNGRPIILSEHCSAPGTRGDIALVDWWYYLIGDRQAMSMASSPHPEFRKNATLYRMIQRLAGQPWIDGAITPAQGGAANSLSPFVMLAT